MMKRYGLFLFLFLAMLFFSCSEQNGVVNEVSLKGHIVNIDTANEHKWPLYLFGDVLYAISNNSFTGGKLTKEKWQKADTLLVSGHGHNEFGNMILSQGNDGSLFIQNCDLNNGKTLSLTKIPHADSIASVKDESKWERYDLLQMPPIQQFCGFCGRFVVMSDSTILVAGAPMKDMTHVFSVINYKNQTVTPLDYWPFESSINLSEKLRLYAENSGLLSNGKDKFLYWNGWGPLAFIFSVDGNHTNILNELRSHIFPKGATTERVTCCADSNRIYLLYKDSTSKGEKLDKYKDPFIFGNTVEMYDWDGVKRLVIHLDHYGQSIMISKDSKTLYLLSDYSDDIDEPYIYSYDLSAIK